MLSLLILSCNTYHYQPKTDTALNTIREEFKESQEIDLSSLIGIIKGDDLLDGSSIVSAINEYVILYRDHYLYLGNIITGDVYPLNLYTTLSRIEDGLSKTDDNTHFIINGATETNGKKAASIIIDPLKSEVLIYYKNHHNNCTGRGRNNIFTAENNFLSYVDKGYLIKENKLFIYSKIYPGDPSYNINIFDLNTGCEIVELSNRNIADIGFYMGKPIFYWDKEICYYSIDYNTVVAKKNFGFNNFHFLNNYNSNTSYLLIPKPLSSDPLNKFVSFQELSIQKLGETNTELFSKVFFVNNVYYDSYDFRKRFNFDGRYIVYDAEITKPSGFVIVWNTQTDSIVDMKRVFINETYEITGIDIKNGWFYTKKDNEIWVWSINSNTTKNFYGEEAKYTKPEINNVSKLENFDNSILKGNVSMQVASSNAAPEISGSILLKMQQEIKKKAPEINIVETYNIDTILEKLTEQYTGLYSEESMVEAGKLIFADKLILLNITALEDFYIVNARSVDIETGVVMTQGTITGFSLEDLLSKIRELSEELIHS